MTDRDRGFIATAAVNPISYVEWIPGAHWFVYVMGFRTGALMKGEASCYYRSVTGQGRMFSSLEDAVSELTRIANWIVVANAELTNKSGVYA